MLGSASGLTRVETVTVWAGSALWIGGIAAAIVAVWSGAGPSRLLGSVLAALAIVGVLGVGALCFAIAHGARSAVYS